MSEVIVPVIRKMNHFDFNIGSDEAILVVKNERYAVSLTTVNDMEQAKPKSQDKVNDKPPKHSCTTEIIAELERLITSPDKKHRRYIKEPSRAVIKRIEELRQQSEI